MRRDAMDTSTTTMTAQGLCTGKPEKKPSGSRGAQGARRRGPTEQNREAGAAIAAFFQRSARDECGGASDRGPFVGAKSKFTKASGVAKDSVSTVAKRYRRRREERGSAQSGGCFGQK